MASIVPSSDDPNNQLAFVQQLVSQLSVGGGNPITINVVAGDIVQTQQNNNQNVQGDYNNNDNSKNILTKEYFDEKVAILSEALTEVLLAGQAGLHDTLQRIINAKFDAFRDDDE
ncbi:hypothetical protein FRACYDRAFT_247404 [Fragilariopsis cylindrus CCMP1102]|uniref:Uncharacterized protein n=1 Tax=Fragilariopsis cylindrus CCMP1102 TaxID=635003 RepID=A0A1E7EWG0_9STRA|nr:hypothetical protein FRACYDRAFT_247404 [Fragilariopsis cylindrus CCMP1102]|eukprot:OEU10370.1 hypothetical protein FRACYDRAFT_247404 [Fragilariopsis cylindrus CCMP1102]